MTSSRMPVCTISSIIASVVASTMVYGETKNAVPLFIYLFLKTGA